MENKQGLVDYSVIGRSSAMLAVFSLADLVASSSSNVLITGESGSGKEMIARIIHGRGSRKNFPFVPINCTAIPENLLESELFGYMKGSFTGAINNKKGLFEEADGGTLFLDEIGDLSLPLQAKMLRVLQDKQIRAVGGTHLKLIDVRIIAATHRDLRTMVRHGEFREDLYYRLNVIPIKVPPLRERKEDIPLLVKHFLNKFSQQAGFSVKDVSGEALAILMRHTWPGNVRELENVIERAIVLSHGEMTENAVILDRMSDASVEDEESLESDRPTLEKLEERYIKKVLQEVDHKIEDAAKVLGISRRTLYRKERLYGMAGFQDEGTIDSDGPEDHIIN